MGSLFAALASYLQARANKGAWLLRIDDIDSLRLVPGANDAIIKTLEFFGLEWDESIYYQSHNVEAYQDALSRLEQQNNIFRCICARKKLTTYRRQNPELPPYPGFCRKLDIDTSTPHAIRSRVYDINIEFNDRLQGHISENPAVQHGDFIIKRRDNIFAYQLAVVVDDYRQGITEVVRGIDLLDSTIKQIHLQQLLLYPSPDYMHIPVIIDTRGDKLSKQTFADAVKHDNPGKTLVALLNYLKQKPPAELADYPVNDILNWAIQHWNPSNLKKIKRIKPEIASGP